MDDWEYVPDIVLVFKDGETRDGNIKDPSIEGHIEVPPIENSPIEDHIEVPIEDHIEVPIEDHIEVPIEDHIEVPVQGHKKEQSLLEFLDEVMTTLDEKEDLPRGPPLIEDGAPLIEDGAPLVEDGEPLIEDKPVGDISSDGEEHFIGNTNTSHSPSESSPDERSPLRVKKKRIGLRRRWFKKPPQVRLPKVFLAAF